MLWKINFTKVFLFSYHTSEDIRSITLEVKTRPLRINDNNKYFQCIGLSKRPNFIHNRNDTYIIHVDGNLKFQLWILVY